jgi:hypothetical protein
MRSNLSKVPSGVTLYRVLSSYFVAGILVQDDQIVEAAPIIRWLVGKSYIYLIRDYAPKKLWTVESVE